MEVNSASIENVGSNFDRSCYEENLREFKAFVHKNKALDEKSTEFFTESQLDTSIEDKNKKSKNVIIPYSYYKIKSKPRSIFKLLQKWEGTVIEIEEDIIRAQIHDLLNPNQPLEEITFSIEEVSPSDRSLIIPGAIFYWMIGYIDHINGQRTKESRIVFRRLPMWRKDELKSIQEDSKPLIDLLPDDEIELLRKRFDLS